MYLDLRMMPIAALAPILLRVAVYIEAAAELVEKIRAGTSITRTAITAFAAVCYALARLLLEAWWQLTEVAL